MLPFNPWLLKELSLSFQSGKEMWSKVFLGEVPKTCFPVKVRNGEGKIMRKKSVCKHVCYMYYSYLKKLEL